MDKPNSMRFSDPCAARFAKGEVALGSFVFTPDAATTEILAGAGFDYAVIDLEHAPLSIGDILSHARAADAAGISCWARVGYAEPPEIGRILDTGVQGLIMSHFGEDLDQSRRLLDAFHYPPAGSRGTCSGVRGLRYQSDDLNAEIAEANARAFSIGLIEDAAVVDRIDEVLELKGLDAVMAGGAGDLSASMGLHGQGSHPRVRAAGVRIIERAKARGLKAGVYLGELEGAEFWRDVGVDFYAYSIDYKVLAKAYRAARQSLAGLTPAGCSPV
ncbi:MAG: aldolase/citrate lyase family protein [Pseudomonadota bacterium]